MEHDADHFPENPFSWEDMIPSDKLLISEDQFAFLEERLDHIHQRAKYYGEHSFSKTEFLDMVGELQDIARTIRRTAG